jgi:L-fucose mutarotase
VLRQIPPRISPEMMYHLMRMGHGDELVLADGDFPVETYSSRVVYAYGLAIPELLEAILPFFPLDPFVDKPAAIMAMVDKGAPEPKTWSVYRSIIAGHENRFRDFEYVERFDFYKRAKNAYLVVATTEPDGNVILKKGVVMM